MKDPAGSESPATKKKSPKRADFRLIAAPEVRELTHPTGESTLDQSNWSSVPSPTGTWSRTVSLPAVINLTMSSPLPASPAKKNADWIWSWRGIFYSKIIKLTTIILWLSRCMDQRHLLARVRLYLDEVCRRTWCWSWGWSETFDTSRTWAITQNQRARMK